MAKPQKKEVEVNKKSHRGVVYSIPKQLKALRRFMNKEWFAALVQADLEFQARDPKYYILK